jgi:Sugar (and other) transporter
VHKRGTVGERGRLVDDGGQALVLNLHGLDRVCGLVRVLGDHHRYRVAEVARLIGRDGRVVGDDQVVAHHPRGGQRAVVYGQVTAGERGDDPGLGTAWILDGLSVTIASSVSSKLTQPDTLNLTTAQAADIGTFYLIGEVIGALVFGKFSDKLGRRKLFIWTLAVYLGGTALTAFTAKGGGWIIYLYATRIIAGMGIGGAPICPFRCCTTPTRSASCAGQAGRSPSTAGR